MLVIDVLIDDFESPTLLASSSILVLAVSNPVTSILPVISNLVFERTAFNSSTDFLAFAPAWAISFNLSAIVCSIGFLDNKSLSISDTV